MTYYDSRCPTCGKFISAAGQTFAVIRVFCSAACAKARTEDPQCKADRLEPKPDQLEGE